MNDPIYPETTLSVAELRRRGYYRTSRKHRAVSRLDRPDWMAVLEGETGMNNTDHGLSTLAHHYRVTLSKDRLCVPKEHEAEFLKMEHSDCNEKGHLYVPLPTDEVQP